MVLRSMLSVLVAGTALVAGRVEADDQTYEQALARAAAAAPGLRSVQLRAEALRAEAQAAGRLPDPRARVMLENVPITGPRAGSLTKDEMTMASVSVMQDMPSRAQRSADVKRAGAAVSSAEAAILLKGREVAVATTVAWTDLFYAEKRLAALLYAEQALEPLWTAQVSGLASGSARPAETLGPERLKLRFEDMRSELVAAVAIARAELGQLTGDIAPVAVGAPPDLHVDPAVLRAELDHHPQIVAFESTAAQADAALDLARAASRPDWAWEVGYSHRDPMFGDMISGGVSVRLPLFNGVRRAPIIAARAADASRVQAEREDARRQLATALEKALADHLMHHEQWVRARDVIARNVTSRADLETASYAAGTATLAEVIEALTEVAETNLLVLEREALVARDAAVIVVTFGSAHK